MKNKVMLPFHIPVWATTQWTAAPGLAIENHPTAYNEMLNLCTTITCTRKFLFGHSSPQVGVGFNGLRPFNCLDKFGVNYRFTYPHIHEIVKRMLDSGFYAYFTHVDDFYMPGKSWYGIRHMNHDGIICGYDDEKKTYSIAAYNINWVFSLIEIPQKCFYEGLLSAIESGFYGNITAYKVKDEDVELDCVAMLKGLKEHIGNTFDIFSLDEDGEVRGVAVYDFLILYMQKLKDSSIPQGKLDWRALRPVWEHKKCMYDRIRAVEKALGWGNAISTAYKPLVDTANHIRIVYAMYQKNAHASLLDAVISGLKKIRDDEFQILLKFIGRLEETV